MFLQLPISVYESVIDLVDGEARMQFVELKYTIATEEAERIGVDHIARLSSVGTSEQSSGMLILSVGFLVIFVLGRHSCYLVAEQLGVQHSAVKMLHTRVRLILDYVQAVQAGADSISIVSCLC